MKQVTFRKIPLSVFIETLVAIHESGANYIDIIGVAGKTQDIVTISVQCEYMSLPDVDTPENTHLINNKTLSDEDLNDFI